MVNKIEITIDVIIHATENINKFYDAFEEMFKLKKEDFTIQNLTGHFNNPIIMLGTKLTKKDSLNFLKTLISKLPKTHQDSLLSDIENRVDDTSLHIRLEKQDFVNGKLNLDEKNAIKIKVYTPVYVKKDIVKAYSDMLKTVV